MHEHIVHVYCTKQEGEHVTSSSFEMRFSSHLMFDAQKWKKNIQPWFPFTYDLTLKRV